jgi:hypothetical protein
MPEWFEETVARDTAVFINGGSIDPLSASRTRAFRQPIIVVMRRTHASLSRKAGMDPKLVADNSGTDWELI